MQISREMLFAEDAFFPACHASTVLPMEHGLVLAAYFAGTHEGADDVAIYLSRRVEGVWLNPVKLAKVAEVAHWNPVLMPIPGGARLIFKVGRTIPEWKSWTMTTSDGGVTWTKPAPIPAPGESCGPVRNKPLYLSDGSMLAPDSVETTQSWRPRIDMSCDYGATFPAFSWIPLPDEAKAGRPVNPASQNATRPDLPDYITGKGAIQPTLWTSGPGKIHALLRTSAGYIFRSDSEDFGRTWCTAYNTGLPNNNSGIDLAKLEGKLYLACNPVSGDWADRTPLVILRSDNGGKTFSPFVTLEDQLMDPRVPEIREGRRTTAEFSYPAIVAKSGKLHVTYTYLRRQIVYREITP